ncbi:hypothetical protein GCM10009546_56980 [Actinomadura livida]|uniref:Secreted protein n=1 Tax=Actinomadura livida TaxID=79909 RepID=A0ABN1FBH7_9ACTN|nr:hypothetical protein GCM10010208_05470 [Actinomadura livida]
MITDWLPLTCFSAALPACRAASVHRPNGTLMARKRGKITQVDHCLELARLPARGLPSGTDMARGPLPCVARTPLPA